MYICMYSFHWIEFMLICNQTTGIIRKKIHVCRDVLCSKSQCERVSYTTRKRILVQVGKSRSMLFWSIMWFQNCFSAVKIHDGESKLPNMYLRLKQWFILTEGLDSKLFLRGAFLYIHDTHHLKQTCFRSHKTPWATPGSLAAFTQLRGTTRNLG